MSTRREEYGNGLYVQGYLNTACTDTDTTIYVSHGDWSVFSTIDSNFQVTVRVDGEIMIVTAISGNITDGWTFTVERDFDSDTPADHNVGSLIYPVLTGASLKRLFRQSLNGTNVTARRELNFMPIGFSMKLEDDSASQATRIRMYMPTDQQYGEMRTPTLNNWTQLAQADAATLATVTYDYNGISLRQTATTSATHRLQALYRTGTVARMKLLFTASPGSTAKFGIMLRQSSTGKMYCAGFQNGSTELWSGVYTDSNTLATDIGNYADLKINPNNMFLRITTSTVQYSADGENYYGAQGTAASFSGSPDQIGFWIDTPPGELCCVRCVSLLN